MSELSDASQQSSTTICLVPVIKRLDGRLGDAGFSPEPEIKKVDCLVTVLLPPHRPPYFGIKLLQSALHNLSDSSECPLVSMRISDYYQTGKRSRFRLQEKGGKFHEVPAYHQAEEYVDAYLKAAGIANEDDSPPLPFRSRQNRQPQRKRNDTAQRVANGEAQGRGRWVGAPDLLPYLQSYWHYGPPRKRGYN